jgi:hypothetical protein
VAHPIPGWATLVDIDVKKGKIASTNFYPDTNPSVATEAMSTTKGLAVQVSVIRSGSEFDIGPYLAK